MKLIGIRRYKSEAGLSMLEYAVAAAGLLGFVTAAMYLLGSRFNTMFTNVGDYAVQQTGSITSGGTGNQP